MAPINRKNSRTKEYGRQYRAAQRQEEADAGFRSTTALLTDETLNSVRELSTARNIRMPLCLGELVQVALCVLGLAKPAENAKDAVSADGTTAAICRAIFESTFEDDTAAQRAWQVAVVQAIALLSASKGAPGPADLARAIGRSQSQVSRILAKLSDRGVVEKRRVASKEAPHAYQIFIRWGAAEALASLSAISQRQEA